MNDLQCYVYANIISADNDEFSLTEDQKQEIIRRYGLEESWESILEPIPDDTQRKLLIDFFNGED